MAKHRALRILQAVRDLIAAADTRAGSDVDLGRLTDHFEFDAVDINPGPDLPPNEFGTENSEQIDSLQTIYVDLHVAAADRDEVLEHIYELRAQTHVALMEDPELGLSGVVQPGGVRYLGTTDLEGAPSAGRLGSMRTLWAIPYRMNYSDPTT